ncbi:hypothetical protein NC651_034455 [Populus alba x Populus x berolinensis]|nr:hypothetical protein NC651_034455 [Populus alba x Populus x berolinensis]
MTGKMEVLGPFSLIASCTTTLFLLLRRYVSINKYMEKNRSDVVVSEILQPCWVFIVLFYPL